MKRFLKSLIFAILLMALAIPGAVMAANENDIYVDGYRVVSDTPTYLKSGVTYVPLRFVSEALGASVSWEADTRTAICYFPASNITIQTQVGSDGMTVNGDWIHHGYGRAEITNSRTFVPLRVIAEATGARVDWVPGRIDITSPAYTSGGVIDVYSVPVYMLGMQETELNTWLYGEPYNITYDISYNGYCYTAGMMACDILSSSSFPENTILDARLRSTLANHESNTADFAYVSSEGPFYYQSESTFNRPDGTAVRMTLRSTSIIPTLDNTMVTYRLVGW